MQIIEVLKPFAWSDNGYLVTQYEAGQIVPVSDDCAQTEHDLGNAAILTEADLVKAQTAHARLAKAADKAEDAADKAEWTAAGLRAKAIEARRVASAARVGRQAEADANELGDDDEGEAAANELGDDDEGEAAATAPTAPAAAAEVAAPAPEPQPEATPPDAPQASLLPPVDQSFQQPAQ